MDCCCTPSSATNRLRRRYFHVQVLSASKALPAATGSASDISTTSASLDDSTASYCAKLDGGTEGHSAAYKDDFR